MQKILANYKNECLKLSSKKKYFVFMIIEMLICVGFVSSKVMVAKISHGYINLNNMNTALTLMTLFVTVIIPFISIMAVCELFAAEFSDGTIRSILVRPTERYKVYIAKIAAVFSLAALNMAAVAAASGIADFAVSGRIANFGYTLAAYVLDLIPMLVVIMLSVMLNQFVKSSTMAMFLCIIVYAGLNVMGIFFPSMSGLVFTGYMQWHKIWLGFSVAYMAASFKALLLIGYGMIFTATGYYIFRFKEC